MDFFSQQEVREYSSQILQQLRNEIERFDDEYITTCDFEEVSNYLYSKYYIDNIVIYEDHITKTMAQKKIRRANPWYGRMGGYEQQYYMVDGCIITYTIPFDGNKDLLLLQPSTYIVTRFEVSTCIQPTKEKNGQFTLVFEYTNQELKERTDINAFVTQQFNSQFDSYKKMIGYVNSDINGFNSTIKNQSMALLKVRKQKAEDVASISKALNIPLELSKNAPNIIPIKMERVKRTFVDKPQQKPIVPEYTISDFDYSNINHIINSCCTSMETTAQTFNKFDEEELRDFILAMLSSHYENMPTGETFRKSGKTDIHLLFDNKAAFIGECKIWHGIKKFEDAIHQLLGYSTWKDKKLSLIVFNKENKDFISIRKEVEKWIKNNASSFEQVSSNQTNSSIYLSEANSTVQLSILLYDLSL